MIINTKRRQGGIVMVETTIVMLIIFILFFAIVEFGRLFYTLVTLNKLQQDGARYLSSHAIAGFGAGPIVLNETGPNGNVFQTRNLVVYGNIAGNGTPLLHELSTANVNVSTAGLPAGFFRVTTVYNFAPIFGNVTWDNTTLTQLTSTVTMRAIN